MRNGLVQLGAWAAATGAAVLLSWLGVHAVLADASFEQPEALPLPAASPSASAAPSAQQVSSVVGDATQRPADATVTPTPTRTPSAPTGSASPGPSPSRKPVSTTTTVTTVRSYLVPGGRVALDMKPGAAELVSATPDSGWQMQFWQGDQWMRFDFSHGASTNSVFVTWNGHPPDVQTVVR